MNRAFWFVGMLVLAFATAAHAQSPPAPSAADLEVAKELFRQGNELRKVGDLGRALELYQRSRAIVASAPNTINVAFCLDKLGRYDEALEMYEELLTKFSKDVDDTNRQAMIPAMAALRRKLGSVDVSANVEGTLVIDGRTRGKLPLAAPIPALPGTRLVRVLKEGYAPFETTVVVAAGQTVPIDARLSPLSSAGRLRVESPDLAGAELSIDGGVVGTLPWEGSVSPGPHLYVVRKGNRGSAPRIANVVEGQTVVAPVVVGTLGPQVRILTDPPSASLAIDGVNVGAGRWQGALPLGPHSVDVRDEGYIPATAPLFDAPNVVIKLEVDPFHPRWAAAGKAMVQIEILGGPAVAPTLATGIEASCGAASKDDPSRNISCSKNGAAFGALVGARGSYVLPSRISVEASAGYLYLSKEINLHVPSSILPGTTARTEYDFRDTQQFSGPFGALGVGYRTPVGRLDFGGGLALGLMFVSTKDTISGTLSAPSIGQSTTRGMLGSGQFGNSFQVFALPELRARAHFGSWSTGIGVAAPIFLLDGPPNQLQETEAEACTQSKKPDLRCAASSVAIARLSAFGRFVAWVPNVSVGYSY